MIVARYEGIDGESATEHAGWIAVTEFAWAALPAEDGRLRRGAEAEEFSLTFPYERACPKLEEHAFSHSRIPSLRVEMARPGPDAARTYLRYVFTDVVVTDFAVHAGPDQERPVFSVSNAFGTVEVTYFEYDEAGSPRARTGYTYRGTRP